MTVAMYTVTYTGGRLSPRTTKFWAASDEKAQAVVYLLKDRDEKVVDGSLRLVVTSKRPVDA